MPEGESIVSVPSGTSPNVNARTLRVTQWVVDPITGLGTWTDVDMQVVVLANERGDPLETEQLLDDAVSELRTIRELLEELMMKL